MDRHEGEVREVRFDDPQRNDLVAPSSKDFRGSCGRIESALEELKVGKEGLDVGGLGDEAFVATVPIEESEGGVGISLDVGDEGGKASLAGQAKARFFATKIEEGLKTKEVTKGEI